MKVLVVGGGGREHAIIAKLAQSPAVTKLYAAPGNGGIARLATCVPISAGDIPALVDYAVGEGIDYAVVAPDGPLVDGAVDAFEARGIPCFGPNRAAAQLEGSKAFAKAFMKRHGIPTADYAVFDDEAAAHAHLDQCAIPVVVKADGLALGKGVTVAATREEAHEFVSETMSGGRFGESGARVVIEECLTGPEVSILAFTDGKTVKPMVSSMDHKRIGEGDTGPNTGGMGTFAPSPLYTPALAEQCMAEIFLPTVRGMAAEGTPFKGCLYFGLMLTPDGPKVIEYNARFGDPETQVVLPLLESDLLEIMQATTEGRLDDMDVRFSEGAAACVVMSAQGYPGTPRTGDVISLPDDVAGDVYVAGAKEQDGALVTSGGRVLNVVGRADDLRAALDDAYQKVSRISFEGAYFRRDIGAKALRLIEEGFGAEASGERAVVRRVYVEKREGEAVEASQVLAQVRDQLGLRGVTGVRILKRYDVAGLSAEQFDRAVTSFLAEPPVDQMFPDLASAGVDVDNLPAGVRVVAVEPLPGQFDQRADSAAQCAQILFATDRPAVRTANVYVFTGEISDSDMGAITGHLVNPVETRVASLDVPKSLDDDAAYPADVPVLEGFTKLTDAELAEFVAENGLAMDVDDLALCRSYFANEERDPTLTELTVIDTYWSDHCRHTTFSTELDQIEFAAPQIEEAYQNYLATRENLGRTKPVCLMDMGTIGAKALRAAGRMPNLDESEEVNACTVHITVEVDGEEEPWLLLFKNETHNHPTEIEPFGGAATCVGGAIRDPLSGRGYVHGAMRLSGAGDPRTPLDETLHGKLPQRTIVTTAADGYSSYGNQIGLATGIVDEVYHPGYVAKHLELGAVVAAVPTRQVRREAPTPGDRVILVGGATGRDGVGGATGSSKSHTTESLTTAGAEVQKGNAPEERKLQRFMRNPEVSLRIKRCNDFGAGGVSVAVGELTDGLDINLDAVPKKYAGLDGTELAVSESQERMALVVEAGDVDAVIEHAAAENLTAVVIAEVTDTHRMRMTWRGKTIVDLSRAFLDTNGAAKHARAEVAAPGDWRQAVWSGGEARKVGMGDGADGAALDAAAAYRRLAGDLQVASKRGLVEQFDSTVGAGTVLMPLGGTNQATPIQAMVHRIPTMGETSACSVMSWGFNPWLTSASPYHGAYLAVVESVAKLVATGADIADTHLTFQEYFERLGEDPKRWGKPVAALLGALEAQRGLGVGAIGGKDSMSGSFEDIDVPPTFVSFAVTDERAENIVANQFKAAGNRVTVLQPRTAEDGALAGLPTPQSLLADFALATAALRGGAAVSAYTPGFGGIAEAVLKMALGEGLGFAYDAAFDADGGAAAFDYSYGAIILEWAAGTSEDDVVGSPLGEVLAEPEIRLAGATIPLADLASEYDGALEDVYPVHTALTEQVAQDAENVDGAKAVTPGAAPISASTAGASGAGAGVAGASVAGAGAASLAATARPTALVPVFPGTNCEYDTARALEAAGIAADVFVVRNRSAEEIARSIEEFAARLAAAQVVVIPGGFSGGDEPDGSAKFITSFFRNPQLTAGVTDLLERRDGLMLGICNGFQALMKLGLIAEGRIVEPTAESPTLAVNQIGRHQSRLVRTRVVGAGSPWLAATKPGDVYTVPISHGEGRVRATAGQMRQFAARGQIATQYVDLAGVPSMHVDANPNGSVFAVEGMTSPDGRVLGKMGHSERVGANLYRNVPGRYEMGLFASAASYLKNA